MGQDLFYFLWMYVCLFLYAPHAPCLQRPKDGVRSSKAGVIGGYKCQMWVLGTEPVPSAIAVSTLNC